MPTYTFPIITKTGERLSCIVAAKSAKLALPFVEYAHPGAHIGLPSVSPSPRGGRQPGAGRPKTDDPLQPYSVRMTKAQRARYLAHGGDKWLRGLLSMD